MTTKESIITTLRGWLQTASIGTDVATRTRLNRIITTSNDISDGYVAIIATYYEPVTPKFLQAAAALNASIIANTATATSFDDHVS